VLGLEGSTGFSTGLHLHFEVDRGRPAVTCSIDPLIAFLRVEVGWLLEELCVDLGFCLAPADQAQIRAAPPPDVDAFTDAVMVAEGLDPQHHESLRWQVRERVARHFGLSHRRPETEHRS
jgi:hypothetical protein